MNIQTKNNIGHIPVWKTKTSWSTIIMSYSVYTQMLNKTLIFKAFHYKLWMPTAPFFVYLQHYILSRKQRGNKPKWKRKKYEVERNEIKKRIKILHRKFYSRRNTWTVDSTVISEHKYRRIMYIIYMYPCFVKNEIVEHLFSSPFFK